jgi:uncharacterized radical SAM protein YgiQ
MAQPHGKRWVVVNPPAPALSPEELDALYRLPFTREAAPEHRAQGGVPALETVRTSVLTHRGCCGGCAFCALGAHQGKMVVSRPAEGILAEVASLAARAGFSGTIQDVGGPTANLYGARCRREGAGGRPGCARGSCLWPELCPHLEVSGEPYRKLLAAIRAVPGVRHAFVASGLRHDLLARPEQRALLRDLLAHHVGGRMKVAPEHVADGALRRMRKPSRAALDAFLALLTELRREAGARVELVPYLIAGHPGTTMEDAEALARYVREKGVGGIGQAQQFTPTPGTDAACMFFSGRDPLDGGEVHVPSGGEAKAQKALLDPADPRRRAKVEGWKRRNAGGEGPTGSRRGR